MFFFYFLIYFIVWFNDKFVVFKTKICWRIIKTCFVLKIVFVQEIFLRLQLPQNKNPTCLHCALCCKLFKTGMLLNYIIVTTQINFCVVGKHHNVSRKINLEIWVLNHKTLNSLIQYTMVNFLVLNNIRQILQIQLSIFVVKWKKFSADKIIMRMNFEVMMFIIWTSLK